MLVYTFDRTLDGVLSAVFDAFFRHQQPDALLGNGEQLPLFSEDVYCVATTEEKATRVWAGRSIERNFSAPDVLLVTNTARRVIYEQLRMKQFIRFQKAKDDTYLGVITPLTRGGCGLDAIKSPAA